MSTETPVKKKRNPSSFRARKAARDFLKTLEEGKHVPMKQILVKNGYSPATSSNPKNVTEQPAFKEEIENYAARLERHRLKVLAAMENKDLDEEQYRTLSDTQAKLTHDVQLLTGGKTENIGMQKDQETLRAIVAAIQIDKE